MSSILTSLLSVALLGWALHDGVGGHPFEPTKTAETRELFSPKANVVATRSSSNCFPSVGFTMPSTVPSSLNNWWCNADTEYGFVGFSYEVTACKRPFRPFRPFSPS